MNRTWGKIKKLRGRSANELRVRVSQAAHAAAERCGWSSNVRLPSDGELMRLLDVRSDDARAVEGKDGNSIDVLFADFCGNSSACAAFRGLQNLDVTARILRERFAAAIEDVCVERARRIVAGRFDLLGLRDVSFGESVDWHAEPLAGVRSDATQHWSQVDFLNPSIAGDKKVTWELNRHAYFLTLARAYARTGDEVFARTFVAHLASWMDANPPKRGINWASNLEVAFRSINWLWSLYMFRASPALDAKIFARTLKFLYLNARHLEIYLSTYFSPNTHLSGEALALYYIGTLLPNFKRAAHWREIGKRVFLHTIEKHIQSDGVYFEQTSYYHRYTVDFCMHFRLLTQANNNVVEPSFDLRLMKQIDHLMYITRPDGTTPFYGDDDGGKFVSFDERPRDDFRQTLATAAAMYERADYKFVSELNRTLDTTQGNDDLTEELLWLCGQEGVRNFNKLEAESPAHKSRQFAASGYYVMRDGWKSDSNYMLFDAAHHGADNGGHAHADALAFDCAAHGRKLFVDPGTFTYTNTTKDRNHFRSSHAHNTLVIDNQSSSEPGATPFVWTTQADCVCEAWQTHRRFDYLRASHDGYARLAAPVRHTREVLFIKNDFWIMRDSVTPFNDKQPDMNESKRTLQLRFHCAADVEARINNVKDDSHNAQVICDVKNARVMMQTFSDGEACGVWRQTEDWVSYAYASRTLAPLLTYTLNVEKMCEAQALTTFLVPCQVAEEASITRIENERTAQLFRVKRRGACDFVMINKPENSSINTTSKDLTETNLRADFAWAWWRVRDEAKDELTIDAINEFVLIDGREAWRGARCLFACREQVGFVVARRAAEKLIVETDAACEFEIAACGASVLVVNGAMRETDWSRATEITA